jgi:hypothetical protein
MGTIDIDTAYSIGTASALLSIISPFFSDNALRQDIGSGISSDAIDDAIDEITARVADEIKLSIKPNVTRKALTDIVRGGITTRKASLMRPYRIYHEAALRDWKDAKGERLFYIASAESIASYSSSSKEGKNPLSPLFMTTTNILRILGEFDASLYDNIAFMFPQPVIQTLIPGEDDNGIFLEDILSGSLNEFLDLHPGNDSFEGNPLRKRIDDTMTVSLWHYNSSIFRQLHKREDMTPESIEQEKKKAYIAKRLLGFSLAKLIDSDYERIMAVADSYDLPGIPIFSEKTSFTTESLLRHATKLSRNTLVFHHVGENLFSSTKLPLWGVNEKAALNYLQGHIQKAMDAKMHKGDSSQSTKWSGAIHFSAEAGYEHLIIEKEAIGKRPSIATLYDNLSEEEKGIVIEYCDYFGIGVQRIEQRIVELKQSPDILVYHGRRTASKANHYWGNEIRGKKLMLASDLPGFLDTVQMLREGNEHLIPHIRGSEMAITPLECIVTKLIGRMDRTMINEIIDAEKEKDDELKNNILLQTDSSGDPIPAKRGTLLHHLWNGSLGRNSAHIALLEKHGLTPIDTTGYSEIQIMHNIPIEYTGGERVLFSCHPDALLFMQDDSTGSISIVTMDRKTNPKTSYPELKYLLQIGSYNWVIEQILTREMGYYVDANYVILDKNPFHHGRQVLTGRQHPSPSYRKHQFSPITRFDNSSPFYAAIPQLIVQAHRSKQRYMQNPTQMMVDKAENEENGICKKCYDSTMIVCDYLSELSSHDKEKAKEIISPAK